MIPCLSVNLHTFNNLTDNQVSPQLVAEAIAFVVDTARNQGQTLDDLIAEILAEDPILDQAQRRWLSNIIIQAWESLPFPQLDTPINTDCNLELKYRDNSTKKTLSAS